MDALARGGVRFPGAVSPYPVTLPAHASILTGLLPRRHGVRDNGQPLPGGVATLTEKLARAGYATAAFVSGSPLRALYGLDRGFSQYDDRLRQGAEGRTERTAEATTEAALAWLKVAPSPWFAWVHYYDPHDPYEPPRAFWRPGSRGAYDGEVSYVDYALGRLLDGLDKPGSGPILSVLTADHGESLGEHGEPTHGLFLYESTMAVPLVFHFPGRLRPLESRLPVRLVDIVPTVADLLGLPAPDGVDGVSLVPILSGRAQEVPAAYLETQYPWLGYGWSPLRALRRGPWKLIAAPKPELYDLEGDPQEARNVYAERRDLVSSLARDLRSVESGLTRRAVPSGDAEAVSQLRALGYVGAGASSREAPPGRPDPKDRILQRDQLGQAEALVRNRRFREAVELFDRVLATEADNRYAWLRSGSALVKAGAPREALPRLRRAVELDPEQVEVRLALGEALARCDRHTEAAAQWMEVVRLQPRLVAAWANLGTALLRTGKPKEATSAYERATTLDPGDQRLRPGLAEARLAWASAEAARGNRDLASDLLRKALDAVPEFRERAIGDPGLSTLVPRDP